jgi:apolipoprotein N-acyltransferase
LYFCDEAVGDEPIKVAAIQGNISSNEKWNTSSTSKTYSTYMKYSLEAAEQGADIIL